VALKQKRLAVDSVIVARDIVLSAIFYGIETMLTEPTRANHAEQILHSVLIGFDISPTEAERIAFMVFEILGAVEGPILSGLKAISAPRGSRKQTTRSIAIS
jgi:hypothetical protein